MKFDINKFQANFVDWWLMYNDLFRGVSEGTALRWMSLDLADD